MSVPAWQDALRTRLTERNAGDAVHAPLIEQYRKLAQQTKMLKERNASLMRAVGTVRQNPSSSTVYVSGSKDENPVQAAYISSLESQISSLRDELATLYKAQNQNTQRLLTMTDTLREKEEQARIDSEDLRKIRDESIGLRKKVNQHSELMSEKDRTVQILTDEISTLQLELGQIEERNQILTKDNAKLLQRWLDAKQSEANKMNEANDFYESMKNRHEAVLNWREGSNAGDGPQNHSAMSSSTSLSGNESLPETDPTTQMKTGITSPAGKSLDPTPNG
ncbi:ATG16-domain-containing protein [Flagelloscypha sp. PMI_526]|nr:ATG16-domain-containing protein [Flagelloscypha sp. PMI_526]